MATHLRNVNFAVSTTNNDVHDRFFSKFSHKPIQNYDPRTLNDACVSLQNILIDQTPRQNCLDDAYSLVLERCSTPKSLSHVIQIHAHVLKSVRVRDTAFLNTKLVLAYGKSGSLSDARKLFDGMTERSVFTWNAMIGAYLTNGESFEAVEVFGDMNVLGVRPDASTFTSILKACGELGDRSYGAQVHGMVTKLGFICNVYVTNSLMGMYAKFSCSNSTMLLFERMNGKADVVSWNSVLSTYSASGKSLDALKLFQEMQIAGIVPNTYTFVAILQACGDSSFLVFGKEIHAFLLKSDLHLDMYVANALVVMYTKSGKMREAARIFYAIDVKDSISWNSLLSGFVQNGLYHKAVGTFHEMQAAGQKIDQCSIISMITAAGRLGYLLNGLEIHAYTMKNGLDSDLQVGNTLVDMYAKCCKMVYAEHVFKRIRCKDNVSWTTVIAGYAQNSRPSRAITLFREAQMKGIKSDSVMIGSVLQVCSGPTSNFLVKQIHGHMIRKGFYDLVLENTLVNSYGKCGCVDYASRVFELIKVKNVVSWTSMMCGLVQNGLAKDAFDVFISMKETGIEADSIALLTLLSAVSDLCTLKKGKEIHGYLIRKGFVLQGPVASSLVDMYGSCGTVETSYKVFNHIEPKDLVLWTSMIGAYGMHGLGNESVRLFKNMVSEKLHLDHIIFLAILHACSHSSLVDEGKAFFNSMIHEYGLDPWPEHYACMVDLLGRANNLDEAFVFVKSMKTKPNSAVWCSLLGACKVHSNVELGNFAAKKLLELDPENMGNYVLASNFYALNGQWEDLINVRTKMKQKGLKKDPGCSWVEIDNRVHVFTVRDKSHPESDEIYKKLAEINEALATKGGYVAETKEKVKMVDGHGERLAIAYGLLKTAKGTPIRVTKNLRVCDDCHAFTKLVSKCFEREIAVRDANRFHHFECGICSCGDFW